VFVFVVLLLVVVAVVVGEAGAVGSTTGCLSPTTCSLPATDH